MTSTLLDTKNFLGKLSEPLSKDAIQRTKATETRKGYDTTGYGYQYCVNRFNDILGDQWGYGYHILKETMGAYKSGQPFYDVTVEVSIWCIDKENARVCAGGHISSIFADALKGAITNAFKKTAAFWGVGKEAYEGTIDDDNKPLPDNQENIASQTQTTQKTTTQTATKDINVIPYGESKGKTWQEIGINNLEYYKEQYEKGIAENKKPAFLEHNKKVLAIINEELAIREAQ